MKSNSIGRKTIFYATSILVIAVFLTSSVQSVLDPLVVSAVIPTVTPTTMTPVKHIVMIIQENHPFDNFFGTFPNLPLGYGLNTSVCLPTINPNDTTSNVPKCVKPWNADSTAAIVQGRGLNHTWTYSRIAYNNGKMNGFVYAQVRIQQDELQEYYGLLHQQDHTQLLGLRELLRA